VIAREIAQQVDFAPGAVHGPDGVASDIPAACAAYEEAITGAGAVDLQILGIGTDGHVGFNEPGSSLASRTRIKTLTEQTRGHNTRFFAGDINAVPRHCLTQGLATIMAARHIVLIATGRAKADAVHQLVEGPVSAMWPATILQHHPHVTVLIETPPRAGSSWATTSAAPTPRNPPGRACDLSPVPSRSGPACGRRCSGNLALPACGKPWGARWRPPCADGQPASPTRIKVLTERARTDNARFAASRLQRGDHLRRTYGLWAGGLPLPTMADMDAADRLSPLDAWWLHLEREVQQLHVGSALLFEGPAPSHAQLMSAIESRLDLVPRYRQRVLRVPLDLGRPVWADDPRFRIGDHVRHTTLPRPGTEESLRDMTAGLMSEHLDLSRPLWESWLVDGLEGGRWAMVNKTHHSMIDGISGADIIDVLLDRDPHAEARPAVPWTPAAETSPVRLAASALGDMLRVPLEIGQGLARAVRAPGRFTRQSAVELSGLAQLGEKVMWPESVLDGPIGPRRRWGWARADLTEVKKVKNSLGGTVNDVILAGIAGGFRTFLTARGENMDGRTVRTMVPVSMRTREERGQLGNQVSAVFADLPVGLSDPAERLAAVTRQLSSLKSSGMARGVDSMFTAADLVPGTLFALGARVAARLPQRAISTVTTNVPGPPVPMYLLGHRMTELFPYIPIGADIRITIGIASYAGRLTCGVTGDFDAVPDLQVLCDGIESATEELVALVR